MIAVATKPEKPPRSQAALAEYWRVSEKTIQRLRARGAPLNNPAQLSEWVGKHPKSATAGLKSKLDELECPTPEKNLSGDYNDFEREAGQAIVDESSLVSQLKRHMSFALYKLDAAQRRGDMRAVKEATDQLRHISGVIHDEELRALKLGREIGDTIPKTEVERIVSAMAAASMRCIDSAMPALARQLVGKNHPAEVRAVMEPALLSGRFFQPFVHAAKPVNGQWLPNWIVTRMTDVVDDYIENGGQLFSDELQPPENNSEGGGI